MKKPDDLKNIPDELLLKARYSIKLEDSFYLFVKEAWPHVDHKKLTDIPLVKILCDHMQALYEGRIPSRRLAISIPPGFAKSLIVCVFFPAWVWAKNPSIQFLTGSHSKEFATRDSKKTRDLITSQWYLYLWGHKVQIVDDQNRKTHYETTAKGCRYVLGVKSKFTGSRADIILMDDALDAGDVDSEPICRRANTVVGKLHTRLNISGEYNMICLINQRLGINDPVGHVLNKKLGFEYLNMPLKCEPQLRAKTSIFTDNRKEGENLWKEKFTPKVIAEKIESMGLQDYNAQYQQNPTSKSGQIVDESWFLKEDSKDWPIRFDFIGQYWDAAVKDKETNDYYVCATIATYNNKNYLLNIFRERLTIVTFETEVENLALLYNPNYIGIEDKANGSPVIQIFKSNNKLPVLPEGIAPVGSKEFRIKLATSILKKGISVPYNAPWLDVFLKEVVMFPQVTHDDQVDALSMGMNNIRDEGYSIAGMVKAAGLGR